MAAPNRVGEQPRLLWASLPQGGAGIVCFGFRAMFIAGPKT